MANLDRDALGEQAARELTGLARGLARGLAGQLRVDLEAMLTTTVAFASSPQIVNMVPVQQESFLEEVYLYYPRFSSIAVFDLSGRPLASSLSDRLPSVAERESFQTAARHGHQAWMVTSDFDTERPRLLIHTPIRDAQRRVVAVLGADVNLEVLSVYVRKVHIGGSGQAFVLDTAGRLLLHSNRAELSQYPDPPWMGVPMQARPTSSGSNTYRSGGETRISGYAPVPDIGWTVIVERPERELLAPLTRTWRLSIAGLSASVLFAMLATMFVIRRLTLPLRQLVAAARAIGSGDRTAPLPALLPHGGELGTLVEAFTTMHQAVDEREQRLLKEVSERKEAEARVKASLAEKEVLLKEIHHRVKNNLQIISSLLNLQSRHAADRLTREMFKESRSRVKSMALIHEQLYESEDLARINTADYIQRLTADLFRSYKLDSSDVALSLNVSHVLLGVDVAIPCGLILNELVSNSLQHAFPKGRKGEVCVDLNAVEHDELTLTVSDNGVGLPEALDFRRSESLGLQLVNTLVEQLKGTIEHAGNHGTEFKVTFPREADSAGGPGKWSV